MALALRLSALLLWTVYSLPHEPWVLTRQDVYGVRWLVLSCAALSVALPASSCLSFSLYASLGIIQASACALVTVTGRAMKESFTSWTVLLRLSSVALCVVYVITFCSGSLRQWCSMRCLCHHVPVRSTLVSVLACRCSVSQCVVYVITIHSGVSIGIPNVNV